MEGRILLNGNLDLYLQILKNLIVEGSTGFLTYKDGWRVKTWAKLIRIIELNCKGFSLTHQNKLLSAKSKTSKF